MQSQTFRHSMGGVAALAAALAMAFVPSARFAHAASPTKTYGQVTAITLTHNGSAIKWFSVATSSASSLRFKVTRRTTWVPRSSNADIAGFATRDYAYVLSRSSAAGSVQFDTVPFKPGPVESLTGVVTKTGRQGLIVIRLSNSRLHKVYRTKNTAYYENEQPVDGTLVVHVGNNLTVYAHKRRLKWLALSVDEHV